MARRRPPPEPDPNAPAPERIAAELAGVHADLAAARRAGKATAVADLRKLAVRLGEDLDRARAAASAPREPVATGEPSELRSTLADVDVEIATARAQRRTDVVQRLLALRADLVRDLAAVKVAAPPPRDSLPDEELLERLIGSVLGLGPAYLDEVRAAVLGAMPFDRVDFEDLSDAEIARLLVALPRARQDAIEAHVAALLAPPKAEEPKRRPPEPGVIEFPGAPMLERPAQTAASGKVRVPRQ